MVESAGIKETLIGNWGGVKFVRNGIQGLTLANKLENTAPNKNEDGKV